MGVFIPKVLFISFRDFIECFKYVTALCLLNSSVRLNKKSVTQRNTSSSVNYPSMHVALFACISLFPYFIRHLKVKVQHSNFTDSAILKRGQCDRKSNELVKSSLYLLRMISRDTIGYVRF